MEEFKRFFGPIYKRLQLVSEQQVMPYLMVKDKHGLTPLEKSVKDNDVQISNNLLDLLMKGDKKGLLYSEHVTPKLFHLKKLGIDLKNFFNSQIAYHKVDGNNKNFDAYHSNSEYKIASSNEKCLKNILISQSD